MKLLAICLWLALSVGRPGQPATDSTVALTANGAFFALTVPDAQASVTWYTEKLGLKVVMRDTGSDKTVVVILEGGGLVVDLIQRGGWARAETASASDDLPARGFFKAGAIVADFDKTLATLRARGVPIAYGPYPARADQRANVLVRDNAGNLIQFFGQYAR